MRALAPAEARMLAAAALWLALWLPPCRHVLEADMVLHMTVQLPLLAAVGVMLAPGLRPAEPRWLAAADWLGIPGIVLVIFASTFWMLPRVLDMALADRSMELVKFLSVPLLVGLPLASSWLRMPSLGRAFVLANFIPKLAALGGLYLAAPIRLCAYYRLDQQSTAGWALIAIAAALAVAWFLAAFGGWLPRASAPPATPDARRRRPAPLLRAGLPTSD